MPDLDAIADRLYALKPDEFAAARDAEVREARQAGNRDLAREIGQLRKPTQSAWLVNLLWRDQHDVMEQLFELANELSRAQAEAAGPELRTLTAQRRQLETALLRRAVELGEAAGAKVSDAVSREAQETLSAALARPDVADEVRSGRLVKAASYAGFGALPAGAGSRRQPESPPTTPAREPIDLQAAQRAREEREQREAAQRRLEAAQRAAEAATATLREKSQQLETANSRVEELDERLRTLRDEVQRIEAQLDRARRAAENAQQEQHQAASANDAAQKALSEAERQAQR